MFWFERTACDVLEEMRKMDKAKNYASLYGLIEELQSMCNRMEAHLEASKAYGDLCEEIKKLQTKKKELENDDT